MPYSAEISRPNPSCFLFLIDQSGSMADTFGGGSGKTKADGVADAINNLLYNLVLKCRRTEDVHDYYNVAVIGYGSTVGPALGGTMTGRELVPISEIADNPVRVEERTKQIEDGAGGLVGQTFRFPIWFTPIAKGGTPMCQAFALAKDIVERWVSAYPSCFPPIVFNLSDGEATDGDPSNAAEAIKDVTTTDGSVLLFNAHLSSKPDRPIEFPDSEEALPDQFAKVLFGTSSVLPDLFRAEARKEGYSVTESTRGFVFQGDLVSVIRFLDIGTRAADLR